MKVNELLKVINDGLAQGEITENSEVSVIPNDTLGWIPIEDVCCQDFGQIDKIFDEIEGKYVSDKDSSKQVIIEVSLIGNTALTSKN